MRKYFVALLLSVVVPAFVIAGINGMANAEMNGTAIAEMNGKAVADINGTTNTWMTGTADHTKFDVLKKKFKTPQDMTKACLSCHTEAGKHVMATSHWNWSRKSSNVPGQKGIVKNFGKKNVVNNFCVGTSSNEPRCTSCHIGFGWKDKNFNFNKEINIDCVVCHEQSGEYKKFPSMAGLPVTGKDKDFKGTLYKATDLNKVAQSVGRPNRNNCGVCHFYGGGANAVKHGDLDSSLSLEEKPDKHVDVHMGSDGGNMSCVDCHVADKHDIKGQLYAVSAENKDRVSCESCHTSKPHTTKPFVADYEARNKKSYKSKLAKMKAPENSLSHRNLDKHSEKIACQTCHIPAYAKKHATKMNWDWSTAGKFTKDKNGKKVGLVKKDENGHKTYIWMKGTFIYGQNVKPEYYWFNGTSKPLLFTDKFDPKTAPIVINKLGGSYGDGTIWPMKVMRGKQIYDTELNNFIQPKLFGKKGSDAFWKKYDWQKAATAGMKYNDLPYSGKFGFIKTEMFWPLSHMVSTKDKALKCIDCHSRDGRLSNVKTNWMPGKDRVFTLDMIGFLMILGSIFGVGVHALLRYIGAKNRNGGKK